MNRSPDAPLVVLATDSAVPSGVGEHMLALAHAIAEGHRVALAFPPGEEGAVFLKRAAAGSFCVQRIQSESDFSQWLDEVAAAVLHVHAGIGWEGHGLARAGWMAKVPVIRTEHLPYLLTDEAQKVEHRLGVGLVDRLVFVSEAVARTYDEAGFLEARSVTVQNGIAAPHAERSREASRQLLGMGSDDFVVITVARFTPQKNHALLFAAARHVAQAAPQTRFVWVGDGPGRDVLQEQAIDSGLAESIMFLGERNDVPDLLNASDLFVLPSRFEGLPIALLEAMALGLAIVATRIGGTCEALGDDYPWLVEPEDPETLVVKILDAVAQKNRRHALGLSNRRRFDDRFGAPRMGREMAAIYREVISGKACIT